MITSRFLSVVLTFTAVAFALAVSTTALAVDPMISTGVSHTLALDRAGNMVAWGSDADGKLGQGRQISFAAPRLIDTLPPIAAISVAGDESTPQLAALDKNGNVWTWGAIGAWLGDRGDVPIAKPGRVLGINTVAQVAAGRSAIAAMKQDGTVWYWGVIDGLPGASQPTQIAGITDAVRIAAGDRMLLAQRRDGSLWALGRNDCGELGDGTTTTRNSWVRVPLVSAPTEFLSVDGQSAAIVGGTLYTWGSPVCQGAPLPPRQVADGVRSVAANFALLRYATIQNTVQQAVVNANGTFTLSTIAPLAGAERVTSGLSNTYGLANGLVRATGSNGDGQLGNGSYNSANGAVTVSTVRNAIQVMAPSGSSAFALTREGAVYGWGLDSAGQISGAGPGGVTVPKSVVVNSMNTSVKSVHSGDRASYAVLTDGRVLAWGFNGGGILATGDTVGRSTPTLTLLSNVSALAAGPFEAIVLKVDGTVSALQLGSTVNGVASVEAPVAGLTNIRAIAAGKFTRVFFAIDANGQLFGWGINRQGALGNGSKSEEFAPPARVNLPGPVDTVTTSGSHTLARLRDGRVFAWGKNDNGQLGDGTKLERLSPVEISLPGATSISAGVVSSLARMNDGTVAAWGFGPFTGTNQNTDVLIPTRVDGLSSITQVSAGYWAHSALRSDGTVYVWGESRTGAGESTIGDGTLVTRLTPVLAAQINGGGRVDTNDWYLDLDASVANNVPAALTPKSSRQVVATGSTNSLTASASIATRAADVGRPVGVYVMGVAPRSFVALANGANSGQTSGQAATAKASKADSDLVLVQLTPAGWQVVTGQLTALITNVVSGSATAQNILRNINLNLIPGARFCIGYGTDSNAMLQAGTLSEVLALPGAASTQGGLPCVVSGIYLSGPASSRAGSTVRLTASVVGIRPSGTAQFKNGSQNLGAALTLSAPTDTQVAAVVNLDTSTLPVGDNALSAVYSGDGGNNPAATSAVLTHRVSAAAPIVATIAGPATSQSGSELRLTVTVTGDAPTGSVQVRDGAAAVGAPATLVNGVASVSLTGLAPGARSLTAAYLGDARNAATTSAAFTHIVEAAVVPPPANVPTLTISGGQTARPSEAVSFSLTHSNPQASGNLSWLVDGVAVTTSTLVSGQSSVTLAFSSAGTYNLVARLDGASPLQSAPFTVTVAQPFSSSTDSDGDGVNDALEDSLGLNPLVRDNDVFANSDLGRRLFVMQQFRDFLGRDGDTAGINFWVAEIAAGRQTRTTMASTFFNSPEFQSGLAPIARLYFATYLRVPDYAGLLFWSGELSRGRSLVEIGNVFATAPEFTQRYGNLSDRDYVNRLYQNILGRQADAAGIEFWTAQLAGGVSRGAMLTNFSESAEYKARINNAVFVNAMYVAFLRRGPDAAGFDFWRGELDRGRSGLDLVNVFLGAQEYRARFL
jgi:alpha-tubulin suppressor-like RCC1 family protein